MDTNTVPVQISEFLSECRVMSMATVAGKCPYCAPVFFAWDNSQQYFIVKSSASTIHFANAVYSGIAAGSVLPDVTQIAHIRGLQFNGICRTPVDSDEDIRIRKLYYSRYPIGKLIDGDFLLIFPDNFKYTDNRMGFGKKLLWVRQSQ